MQENLEKRGAEGQTVGGFSGGYPLWTFCSSNRPLRKHGVLSGACTGRLHLERYHIFKTKGCVFRLLLIPPLRLLCSRVANVFTGDAGRVFLISYPLSLADFLCVMTWLLCVEKMREKRTSACCVWLVCTT